MRLFNRKSFLRFAGLVTAILGLSLMLFPTPIVTYFDGGLMPNTVHFVRFLGTALLGYGVLNWLMSSVAGFAAWRATLYANLTSLILASLIDIIAISEGELNRRGWLILLLHIGFTIGFGLTASCNRRPAN